MVGEDPSAPSLYCKIPGGRDITDVQDTRTPAQLLALVLLLGTGGRHGNYSPIGTPVDGTLDGQRQLQWNSSQGWSSLPATFGVTGMLQKFRSFRPISFVFLTYVLLTYFVCLYCANIHIHLPSFSFVMT